MSLETAGDYAAAAIRTIAAEETSPGERAVAYACLASVEASAEVARLLLMLQRGIPVEDDSAVDDLGRMIQKLDDGFILLRQRKLLHEDGP